MATKTFLDMPLRIRDVAPLIAIFNRPLDLWSKKETTWESISCIVVNYLAHSFRVLKVPYFLNLTSCLQGRVVNKPLKFS